MNFVRCKNDCYYCGIRRSNANAERYRLEKEIILDCCNKGYELGYRTFVLQGGEDGYFTDERVCEIVGEIRKNYSDCAITLSIGEKTKEVMFIHLSEVANTKDVCINTFNKIACKRNKDISNLIISCAERFEISKGGKRD